MATKLGVFNAALREVGAAKLSDTGDPVENARVLVDVYSDVVNDSLAAGSWNFAMETIKAASDTGTTPNFGYPEVFAKPSDWVRTYAVSEDPDFTSPLLYYYDDQGFWSANNSPIYVRYVSNDTGAGFELTRWPRAFTRYVELHLAHRIVKRISESTTDKDEIRKELKEAKRNALAQDAMNEAQPKFPPESSWTTARRGGVGGDRGSRTKFTG